MLIERSQWWKIFLLWQGWLQNHQVSRRNPMKGEQNKLLKKKKVIMNDSNLPFPMSKKVKFSSSVWKSEITS